MISCDHCGMIFKYNCHLEKHLSRKFPCYTNIPTELSINSILEKDIGECKNMGDNDTNIRDISQKYVGNGVKNEKNIGDFDDEKPYSCDKCDKRYVSKRDFKRHMESCNGLNVLQCPTCHKTFSHRAAKSRHIKNVKCSPPKQTSKTEEQPNVVRKKITATVKLQIGASLSWRCNICHDQLKSTYHIDHIIQICRGGTNAEDNLQALCVECHADKTQKERQV